MGLSNYPVNKNDSHDHTPYWKVPSMRSNKTLKYFYWNFSRLPTGINQFLNVSIYFDLYYNFFFYIYDIQFTQENKIYNCQVLYKYLCTWGKIKIRQ